ncbi:MAG TPA: tetratricopeptide repeat protein [Trebonia sp.]|nr:tetratricopeptide repeat protein [Trebonia sp.]
MTQCIRPGCSGQIGDDGYCEVCLERPDEVSHTVTRAAVPPATAAAARLDTAPADLPAGPGPGHPVAAARAVGFSRRASGDPWWGLDLVSLPEIPVVEPAQAVQVSPRVPESQRICGHCGAEIGRSHHGQAALATGFCHKCEKPYAFVPKLQQGTMVADRYLVSGCVGYGGLGWVFLAEDTHLKDQPVVLKGLINAGNRHAAAAAERELRFLTEVDHPNIVRVRDFAAESLDGADDDEYIVMEYIPGPTVDHLASEGGLSVENAMAYCLHLLAAVEHLHSRDWLHCDIKPPNLMLAGTGVKLIDLGAGCRKGATGHTWGTEGYRAPEVLQTGPSVRSDLFSVGQTLRTMLLWSQDGAPGSPVRQATESVDNFLDRATAHDPADRFRSAAEMAGQLSGVLREVVAWRDRRPQPAPSLLFGPEPQCLDTDLGRIPPLSWWTGDGAFRAARDGSGQPLPDSLPTATSASVLLPAPRPDPADPAFALLLTLGGGSTDSADEQLASAAQGSVEINLSQCRARLADRDIFGATRSLDKAKAILAEEARLAAAAAQAEKTILAEKTALAEEVSSPGDRDWRIRWHDGLIKLATNDPAAARADFDAVYRALPGEVVPKLALGLCQEYVGELAAAEQLYQLAWRADRSYVSLAFGLARTRIRLGDRTGAVTAVNEVPDMSRHVFPARVAAFRLLTGQAGKSAWPAEEDLAKAGDRLGKPPLGIVDLGAERHCRLRALLLAARLRLASQEAAAKPRARAERANADKARMALEDCYRQLAKFATSQSQHTILVDLANRVRARTLD